MTIHETDETPVDGAALVTLVAHVERINVGLRLAHERAAERALHHPVAIPADAIVPGHLTPTRDHRETTR